MPSNKVNNEGAVADTVINMEPENAEIDGQAGIDDKRKEGNLKRCQYESRQSRYCCQGRDQSKINDVNDKLNKVPGASHDMSIFADYRKFLDRGNVINLAVAVVIGAAFTNIVESLVKDIISPILAVASGRALEENFVILKKNEPFPDPDYSARASVKVSDALSWNYGNFIQTVINFFIISACVFVIVKLYEMGRRNTKTTDTKKCPYCAGSVVSNTVRCPRCTSWLDLDVYAKSEADKARRLENDPFSFNGEKPRYAPPPGEPMNYQQ
ncbi:hypothetical protein BGZ80_003795 [Entomortierella chlamydospora]|uniref:Large-conductance mechanosensitive channel n=1 Tax=Entomortierella chlamydospora TaxID=101097 RepID=A0A9P6T2S8_9FUNG|nr:hypothetical protein BGZ79_010327 [Entomortierella chlamydospora]KAG0020681.1 hypothetical protein BGZ80_003795 [Entomortierella chlamydospora]